MQIGMKSAFESVCVMRMARPPHTPPSAWPSSPNVVTLSSTATDTISTDSAHTSACSSAPSSGPMTEP
eukprot:204260-Prymnesium_polylepis.1